MVDAGGENNFGGLEWVVRGELNLQEENTASVWAVLRSNNSGLPLEHVITDRAGAAVGRGVLLHICQLLLNSGGGEKASRMRHEK